MARLLVVEDEPRLRSFLVRVLERDGHVVVTASTGPEGVRLATEVGVEGVLLDLMLPGYDGFEVLRRVLDHDPEQCVIVLSAVSDVASRVRCLSMGATDFLAKPFATSELTARVKARLRTPAPNSSQRWLQVGDVSLDSERRSMTIDGHEVSLSQREFVLLTHLMRKPGLVCTRDELLASVWGYTFDPGSNVVDVYVRRVRSKLPRQVIETVRNVGYSYVAS
jgi:DNA-binding response OmpR family regulator